MKQKKLFRLLICALAVALTIGLGVAAFAMSSGDVNGDGKVTAFDAQLIAEANAGLRTLTDQQKEAAGGMGVRELVQYLLNDRDLNVYLAENGSDDNSGKANAPYATLEKALAMVPDGGTIRVTGSVTVADTFRFPDLNKSVTISGGSLDFSAYPTGKDMNLRDPMRFEGVSLLFRENQIVMANGNKLYMDENVTMNTPITLYGGTGSYGAVVDGTDMTILGGQYSAIYGGSYQTQINGDVNLVVGGNVNPALNTSNHNLYQNVYGGSKNGNIDGKVTVTVTGNAKVCNVYGGCDGNTNIPEVTITGGSVVNIESGTFMGICGGGRRVNQIGDATVNFSGGNAEHVFGGCERGPLTGDVAVKLTGGTISRRVYGGCYNECGFSFDTAYYVTGNITLTITESANITLKTSQLDRSIYARSRQNAPSETEVSTLVFADQAAYDAYSGKLGAQDSTMKSIMGSISAADNIVKQWETTA